VEVTGDTQAQNAVVFGLAHLLGIRLMPRIRNWKDLTLYRPTPQSHYEHINTLLSGDIDWDLIERMFPTCCALSSPLKMARSRRPRSWANSTPIATKTSSIRHSVDNK
jgi:TnpA family transposase